MWQRTNAHIQPTLWPSPGLHAPWRWPSILIATVRSAVLVGIGIRTVLVEVDVSRGLPCFDLVGLPDSAVRESRDRVRSALRNSGFPFPVARITVNLAPGDVRKVGPIFDLPIALAILAAQGGLPPQALNDWLVMGELALDGSVRAVRGVLCVAASVDTHKTRIMVPAANAHELELPGAIVGTAVATLTEAVQVFRGQKPAQIVAPAHSSPEPDRNPPIPIQGQEAAKRALQVAVAGGHHALLVGPPGSGKTLLAEQLVYTLPKLTPAQRLEVSQVYSAAGLLPAGEALPQYPPLRAPHHALTKAALLGGGNPVRPGELSLAHHGILFLDEVAEFQRDTLEALRQPLEAGFIEIARSGTTYRLPCRIALIAAANPCPCGWLGDERHACTCSPSAITRYRRRLSGPLLDRIDLYVPVGPAEAADLLAPTFAVDPWQDMQRAVARARATQSGRNPGASLNAYDPTPLVKAIEGLPGDVRDLLRAGAERLGLTGRGVLRAVRVARTIADLAGSEAVALDHMAEAIGYRLPPYME